MTKTTCRLYAVITSVLFAMIVIAAIILWTHSLQPVHVSVHKTIHAEYVPTFTPDTNIATDYEKALFSTAYARLAQQRKKIAEDITETSAEVSVSDSFEIIPPPLIPREYTEIQYPYLEYPLYVFLDEYGTANYRVSAERVRNGQKETGFLEATQTIRNLKMTVEYDEDGAFVDIQKEPFGKITLVNAPENETQSLNKAYGIAGTYYIVKSNGEKEYYVYGHYENGMNAFFLAGEDGTFIPGSLPLTNIPGGAE